MAAVPHVNKAKVAPATKHSMVMKSNSLGQQMTAPATLKGGEMKTVQQFFAERNVTPNDNRLMKKAPARVSAEDVLTDKLLFSLAYAYNSESGQVELANNFYFGGWTVDMEQTGDNTFNTYPYFTEIPFVINVDYEAGTAEMEMGEIYSGEGSGQTQSGQYITVKDTVEALYLLDEAYIFDEDAEEPTNLQGTLYSDGTIYFPNGWCIYLYQLITTTVKRGNTVVSTTTDTVQGLYTDFMRDTYYMTPNATHQYTSSYNGKTYSNLAYMFQDNETDTIAYAWNLWEFGNRGAEYYLHEDGSMVFPGWQIVGTDDVDDLEADYPDYDWQTYGYNFYNFADNDNDDAIGEWTPTTITWPSTIWTRFCIYSGNGNTYGLSYTAFTDNILTFTDDEIFMMGTTADPVINAETTDDAVIVTLELEEGADYLMMVGDEYVESPYSLPRTDEEYTVTVYAIAQVYGKHMSNVVSADVTVPALAPSFLRGDVDKDESVGIGDVSSLIDLLLAGGIVYDEHPEADCDQDGTIGIGDVSALIDFLLKGYWVD